MDGANFAVRGPSYFKNLLLHNNWGNFNQNKHKSSFGKVDSSLAPIPFQGEIIAKLRKYIDKP